MSEDNFFVMFIFNHRPPAPLMDGEGKVKYFPTSDAARNFMMENHASQEREIHCIGKPGIF